MGDVISWSKLNKIKRLLSVVKDDVSNVKNTFLNWSKDWTTARAEKIDTVTANSETIKSTTDTINTEMAKDASVARQATLNTVKNNVIAIQNIPLLKNGVIKNIQTIDVSGGSTINEYTECYTDFNISQVNLSKSFLLFSLYTTNSSKHFYCNLISENKVRLGSETGWNDSRGVIKVVEFN